MFFLAFAGSIRIFTLFLNLANSEIFLIPAIILLAIIFSIFQHKSSSWASAKDPGKSPLLIGEGKGEVLNKSSIDSSAKVYTASSASEWQKCSPLFKEGGWKPRDLKILSPSDCSFKKERKMIFKPFLKNLLRWIIGNLLAIVVISWHLYHKNPEYFQQFIWLKNNEYTTPERKIFNDFVRISDTQKYHRYYVETEDWKTYALNSEKDYHIWDIIYISASQKDLDFSNIFSLSWNAIFTKEFWNYDFNYDKWLFMKWVDGSMYEKVSIFNVIINPI